ncbi:hypothetical protein RIF23_11545 [Lipingzhangella sp. LS1_29]|uniref:Uncharacterized protein n=1 Tax=Lipingzhangella rawalii TaxID=2055835 RepID=A0ABU2H7H5_9ACTN|nr:hypothetical protein [Lipingzhangella rawalii]MDS1270932.1 hypothetical protein [Lipingzhangella rawalii]
MQRFAVGLVCNIAIIFVGFFLLALVAVGSSDILDPELVSESDLDFWLRVMWAPTTAVFAVVGALVHARLTPRSFLGATLSGTVAAVVSFIVVLGLNFPYIQANLGDHLASGTILGAAAVGAAIGGILGAVTHREDA